jgi:hypothetical protein
VTGTPTGGPRPPHATRTPDRSDAREHEPRPKDSNATDDSQPAAFVACAGTGQRVEPCPEITCRVAAIERSHRAGEHDAAAELARITERLMRVHLDELAGRLPDDQAFRSSEQGRGRSGADAGADR